MFLSSKEIYYHGTSTKFTRSILKEGFVPNPKEKIWAQDRLESFTGTYLTKNFMSAYVAAGNAMRKFGGERALFEVQIETKSGLMDEDELKGMKSFIQQAGNHLLTQGFAKKMLDEEEFSAKEVESTYLKPASNLWLDWLSGKRKKEVSKEQTEKLLPILNELGWETIKDIAEHGDNSGVGPKETLGLRKIKEKIINALQGEMSKREVEDFMSQNIRIPTPIKFSGANKILAATEINEDTHELIPLYSKPSAKLIENIKGHIGEKFEVQKSGMQKIGVNMNKTIVKKVVAKLKISDEKLDIINRKEKTKIGKELGKAGLDGNGRFKKLDQAINKINEILDNNGFELDTVTGADRFRGDSGQTKLEIARKTKDPHSPVSIKNSMLIFSWYLRGSKPDTNFEVLVYLS